MIGLDTNILLRALTQDDPVRSPVADLLIAQLTPQQPGYIDLIVLAETVWNLRRRYGANREDVFGTVETLLQSPSFVVAERGAVVEALETARPENLDFADALIGTLNKRAGCGSTLTFDDKASGTRLFTSAINQV